MYQSVKYLELGMSVLLTALYHMIRMGSSIGSNLPYRATAALDTSCSRVYGRLSYTYDQAQRLLIEPLRGVCVCLCKVTTEQSRQGI